MIDFHSHILPQVDDGAPNVNTSLDMLSEIYRQGVKTVIAKCANEMHQKILLRVGADQVVFPENESGIRLAKNLLSSGFIDMISLSKDVSMVEIDVRDEWVGKTLSELELRRKYSINIVAVDDGNGVEIATDPHKKLSKAAKLIVIADKKNINRLK